MSAHAAPSPGLERRPPGSNWAGNHTYGARELILPRRLEELRRLLVTATSLRVLASRHSFNAMADAESLVSLENLEGADAVEVDRAAMTVRVGGAITYAGLAGALPGVGVALENRASLPHISVAGAIATATHGSGDRRGNLATAVRGLELLLPDGDLLTLGADDPRLAGAAVHLGALGVVLAVHLAVVPAYEISQHVYDGLSWEALDAHLEEIFALGHSVSVFHRLGARTEAVWVKADAAATPPPQLFDAAAADGPRHPIAGADPANCTPQLGEPGPWSERLPHFRSGFLPSAGAEIQSEVFVARPDAVAAIARVRELAPDLAGDLLVGELRTVAADTLWMSPQYGRDSLGLHFTWRRDPAAVARHVAAIESALAPLGPRVHWGKVASPVPPSPAVALPRAADFASLRAELDPRGVMVNPWLRSRLVQLG